MVPKIGVKPRVSLIHPKFKLSSGILKPKIVWIPYQRKPMFVAVQTRYVVVGKSITHLYYEKEKERLDIETSTKLQFFVSLYGF